MPKQDTLKLSTYSSNSIAEEHTPNRLASLLPFEMCCAPVTSFSLSRVGEVNPSINPLTRDARQAMSAHMATTHTLSLLGVLLREDWVTEGGTALPEEPKSWPSFDSFMPKSGEYPVPGNRASRSVDLESRSLITAIKLEKGKMCVVDSGKPYNIPRMAKYIVMVAINSQMIVDTTSTDSYRKGQIISLSAQGSRSWLQSKVHEKCTFGTVGRFTHCMRTALNIIKKGLGK
jgi:hypothetical protein